jgi:peroxiredoxin
MFGFSHLHSRSVVLAALVMVGSLVPLEALQAGKYNQVLSIGDDAPKWEELPGVDEKIHSFNEWESNSVMVVVFTCNSCPYAVDAEDRLVSLHQRYSGKGVALVAINVNKVEEDLLPAMMDRATEKGFPFPYLFDESQQIARRFGAMATPECYVLDRERKIRYMGAIDDSPDGKSVSKRFLESAINAVLASKTPAVTETVPIGCRVRFERSRGSRRSRSASDP